MKTFHSNCTLPSEPSFVSGPNTQGTVQIVWSCVSVLILSTWSIQHPNLPIQVRNQTFKQTVRFQLYQARRKAYYMVFAILVPEYFVTVALSELVAARELKKKFQALPVSGSNAGDPGKWSLTHTFFANMGGFQIVHPEELLMSTTSASRNSHESRSDERRVRTSHTFSDTATSGSDSAGRASDLNTSLLGSCDEVVSTSIPLSNFSVTDSDDDRIVYCDNLFRDGREVLSPEYERAALDFEKAERSRSLEYLTHMDAKITERFGNTDWTPSLYDFAIRSLKELLAWDEYERDPHHVYHSTMMLQGSRWVIDAGQLLHACECGPIYVPETTIEDIKDKSKSDILIKVSAMSQILWLIIQVISRAARAPSLPSSPLEIGTIAIVSCMFWIYLLLWDKPQSVATAVSVRARRLPTPEEIRTMACESDAIAVGEFEIAYGIRGDQYVLESRTVGLVLLSGVLLGAIYCFAWDYKFPTQIESVLWKIAVGITTGYPLLFHASFFGLWSMFKVLKNRGPYHIWERNMLLCIAGTPYVIARLFIMVEMVRSLYYLPPGAYITTWASEIPSIG